MGIDQNAEFRALRIAVVVVSDSRDLDSDVSGAILAELLQADGHVLAGREVVRDDRARLAARLQELAADDAVDVVVTTGGTGLTGRDVTPEALEDVAQKLIPGFGELFRWQSYEMIGTSTIQSRACAGLVDGCYVFCLPGSRGAVRDGWEKILRYQLDIRHRPCNFAELLPRLKETDPNA